MKLRSSGLTTSTFNYRVIPPAPVTVQLSTMKTDFSRRQGFSAQSRLYGAGFTVLVKLPHLAEEGQSLTLFLCECAASLTTGPPLGFAEPYGFHLHTSNAYRHCLQKCGQPHDGAHLEKKMQQYCAVYFEGD